MIDGPFRARLPYFVGPLIRFYGRCHLSPNHITLIGFILSLVSAFLITSLQFTAAICIWWLSRLFDGTDGIYARASGQTTAFGSHLDILLDMASYSTMIVAFSIVFPDLQILWTIVLLLYVLCITGALSLGALQEKRCTPSDDNRGLRFASGIAEGGETGLAYTLFLLFPDHIQWLAYVWIGVLSVTVIARMFLAWRELRLEGIDQPCIRDDLSNGMQ